MTGHVTARPATAPGHVTGPVQLQCRDGGRHWLAPAGRQPGFLRRRRRSSGRSCSHPEPRPDTMDAPFGVINEQFVGRALVTATGLPMLPHFYLGDEIIHLSY